MGHLQCCKPFVFLSLVLLRDLSCGLDLQPNNYSTTSDAVAIVIMHMMMSFDVTTTNLIAPESVTSADLNDFRDELLSKIFATGIIVRQDSTLEFISVPGRRKRFTIILIATFGGFLQVIQKISPKYFWFNGHFLVVAVNGEFSKIEDMFKYLWMKQIYNANLIIGHDDGTVMVKTFIPFNVDNCNDTTPKTINSFKDGKFEKSVEKLYPKKMKNLLNCPIRVAISNNSKPLIFAEKLTNGEYELHGRDINLINTLSESLNFRINYTFIGDEGFFLENGTAEGPLRALLDDKSDFAVSDWWLKANRLKFLDSTYSYFNDKIVFLIPPGRELSTFEKLFFPFELSVWVLIGTCFLVGFAVIAIVTHRLNSQDFVFGSGVGNPYLNMFIGFIGGGQKVLPKRNFARFLLMMFLMYSLVIRSVYQGSFYRLMQSNKREKEVQSIDEMIKKNFIVYVIRGVTDVVKESGTLTIRFKLFYLGSIH